MKTRDKGTRGFSIIEAIVILACITILSAIVAPSVSMYVLNSKVRTIEEDLTAIRSAVCAAHADLGVFPDDADQGFDPGLRSNQAVPVGLCAQWKGPYIEAWPSRCPWGGTYDYQCGRCEAFDFDFDFVSGNEVYIVLEGSYPSSVLDSIDADLDDGMRFSGRLRHDGASLLCFYLGEGRCWKTDSLD